MASSFNRVIIAGNITREIDLKHTQSGTAVVELGVAMNDRRKGSDGNIIEETTFVDVTVWGRQAENVSEYLSKGSSVLVEGRLKLDRWEKDGEKRTKLRVVADNVQFLDRRQQGDKPVRTQPNKPSGGGDLPPW